jgi:U3 small nucleolar RNA-associated protein 4
MHSHDVRALAIWPPYTPLPNAYKREYAIDIAPILASGGLDMSVVLTPAALPTSTVVKITNPLNTSTEATFEDAYHRKLAYVQPNAMRVSRSSRLVSCIREAALTVWRIQKKPEPEEEPEPEAAPVRYAGGWDKVLEMNLNVHSNITNHEISDDGHWLAVSDLYETKLFALRTDVCDISCILYIH